MLLRYERSVYFGSNSEGGARKWVWEIWNGKLLVSMFVNKSVGFRVTWVCGITHSHTRTHARTHTDNKETYSFLCSKFNFQLPPFSYGDRGSTVVKVLLYKSEGRWFDTRWCHWNFSLTYSFRSHYGPGVTTAYNRNEYQEYFLGGKNGRFARLTTFWAIIT